MASRRQSVQVRPVPPSFDTRASSNSRTTVFQTENESAILSVRSAGQRPASSHEPILWRGSPSATRRVRVRIPLGSLDVSSRTSSDAPRGRRWITTGWLPWTL